MKKCKFCGKDFQEEAKIAKEHVGLCPYCIVRLEMAWWFRKPSGKMNQILWWLMGKRKKMKQVLNLTNKEVDEGMKRFSELMRRIGMTAEEFISAMASLGGGPTS